jgi:hypothetical protein
MVDVESIPTEDVSIVIDFIASVESIPVLFIIAVESSPLESITFLVKVDSPISISEYYEPQEFHSANIEFDSSRSPGDCQRSLEERQFEILTVNSIGEVMIPVRKEQRNSSTFCGSLELSTRYRC